MDLLGLSRLCVLCFYLTITADIYQQKITVTILLVPQGGYDCCRRPYCWVPVFQFASNGVDFLHLQHVWLRHDRRKVANVQY